MVVSKFIMYAPGIPPLCLVPGSAFVHSCCHPRFAEYTREATTMLPAAASTARTRRRRPASFATNRTAGDTSASVACEVCKHAVCGECDQMLAWRRRQYVVLLHSPDGHAPLDKTHAFHCTDPACERPRCAALYTLRHVSTLFIERPSTLEYTLPHSTHTVRKA